MSNQTPSGSQRIIGDKYKVIRQLGEGAMGEVYEAENTWTRRRVAIKVLRRDIAKNPGLIDRFLQEGRSTTMISHPNIIDVLDMGKDLRDGSLYMVQEFLTGIRLDQLLSKQKSLPLRDTLDIAIPIMGGLVEAHKRSVVHRDIKPENIILARSGQGKVIPKLIDFGISKLRNENRRHTSPGMLMGTPQYMAPEQVRASDQIDERVDIWAVGTLLYEMLSGRCPFEAKGLTDLFSKICGGRATPLSDVAPDVPRGLEAIIHEALQREADHRHASMQAMLTAILECEDLGELGGWLRQRHHDSLPYQRRHERYQVNWSCRLQCKDWETARKLAIANVSQGGVFLATQTPPSLDSSVVVEITLPDGTHLALRAVVLRVVDREGAAGGRPGVGVRFDDEHAIDLQVLEQVAISHQAPGYQPLPEDAHPRSTLEDRQPSPSTSVSEATTTAPAKPRAVSVNKGGLAEAVGIDFGTTYGSISIAYEDKVYLVPDRKSRTLHPSIVSYPDKGQPVVGWDARAALIYNPQQTVTSVKRVLGRNYDEPMVQAYLHGLSCASAAGPNGRVMFNINGEDVAPIQIAAQVIEHLRHTAEERTGKSVTKAVMTVPLSYSTQQKEAIKRAAQLAGLEVLKLLEEPMAALLAYGFGQGRNEIVAVYDFGGGTFDFSILELSGNKYKVLASGGDAWLGGDDFDLAVADDSANKFWHDSNVDVRKRAVEWQRLLFSSEQTKRILSFDEEAELAVKEIIQHPQPRDLRQKLGREEFESLCMDAFIRSLDVCRSAMAEVGLTAEQIDRLVVTGGTSRIPFIQRELSRFFGCEASPLVDPETSVCIGAGLFAALTTRHSVKEAARND